MEALHGVDLDFFAHRRRAKDEVLPWDHIDCEVTKPFLWKELQKAYEEAEVVDCVLDRCSACGACDYFTVDTRVYKAQDYQHATPAPPRPPEPTERTILRIRYAKEGRLRALSHLETKTAIERALRRAKLPVAFSQGFSPKPKLAFSPALSVGIESRAEYFDATLVGVHTAASFEAALAPQLPPGLRLMRVVPAPDSSLNAMNGAATFAIELPTEALAGLDAALLRFEAADRWPVMRQYDGHQRELDLKQFVRGLRRTADGLQLELLQGGARPGDVVRSLVGCEAKRLVKESVRLGVL
jgi:radical SAM-linked protein